MINHPPIPYFLELIPVIGWLHFVLVFLLVLVLFVLFVILLFVIFFIIRVLLLHHVGEEGGDDDQGDLGEKAIMCVGVCKCKTVFIWDLLKCDLEMQKRLYPYKGYFDTVVRQVYVEWLFYSYKAVLVWPARRDNTQLSMRLFKKVVI